MTYTYCRGRARWRSTTYSLGNFQLAGLPPAPRGVPQIEVTFDIDANGLIHVAAKDKATGKEQSVIITAPQKMSKEEIDKKMREAEQYAAQDKEEFDKAEARNSAEALVYSTDHTLKEFKDKIPKEVYDKVESAKAELAEALKKDNLSEIKEKSESLNGVLKDIGSSMYGNAGGGQGPQQGPEGPEGPQGPGSEGYGGNAGSQDAGN